MPSGETWATLRGPWRLQAACKDTDTQLFFTSDIAEQQKTADKYCTGCEVRMICQSYASAIGAEDGLWGGFTEAQRRRVQRKRARFEEDPKLRKW